MTANKKAPALRFKEFEGEWKSLLGSEITSKITKGSSPKWQGFDYVEEGVLFITSENVREGHVDISKPKYLTKEFNRKQKNSQLVKGDILINIVGASIGRSAIFDLKVASNINQAVAIFRVKPEYLYTYLSYYLQLDATQEQMLGVQSESARPNLSLKNLNELLFAIPSTAEQQKIASFLTSIDDKIQQQTKKKALLEQYKNGILQQIFNQQIRFKDDDGRDYPDWEEKRLGNIGEIVGGGTPDTFATELWNGNIQWFTPTEIKSKYINYSIRTISDEGLKKSSAKILPKGTLLLSSRATVGDVGIALKECSTNQGFQSIIVNGSNVNEFIYYWIVYNKKEFLRKASGSTFLEINKTEISKLKIVLSSKEEQQKIASFLSGIDNKIDLVNQQLEKTKEFKKGLLQGMFV